MKKILNSSSLAFLLIFLFSFSVIAQDNCNPFYILKEGKKWTTSNYNAKDKYQGKQSFEILKVDTDGGKLIATVNTISYDKKDKVQLEQEVEFICEDGVIYMDMSKYVPEDMMNSFKEMDVEVDLEEVAFPENLEVGQSLPDGGVKMTINGPMPMSFEVRIVDRKVMGKENIKVPAGNFDTYKINSVTEIDMMGKRRMKSTEWVAKEIGVVRTESYDKNGDLKYYSILTEYKD